MEVDVKIREVSSWGIKVLLRNEASESDTSGAPRWAPDVSLTDASLWSNTLTSQDLTSLISTSKAMIPTFRVSIY